MIKRTAGEPAEESFVVAALLTAAGGFLDAYTFCCRDHVFANAQTGNIVHVGIAVAMRDYEHLIRYLIPILAFSSGVFLAMAIRDRYGEKNPSAWRQRVLFVEMVVAGIVSVIPTATVPNILANILVSFLCALQAESFRKVGEKFSRRPCVREICAAGQSTFIMQLRQKIQSSGKTLDNILELFSRLLWEPPLESACPHFSAKKRFL